MYSAEFHRRARELRAAGRSVAAIARELGASRAAVRDWLSGHSVARPPSTCFACAGTPSPCPEQYLYLLGQYLGDGYLVTTIRVPRLRIACCDAYPAIAAEVDAALHAVSGNRVGSVPGIGCSDHGAYWTHWPCMLPQHGPGPKHTHRIELVPWQQAMVDADPWPLIRGLIHSDGCRSLNTVTGSNGRRYSYPRYFFANESRGILAIMGDVLDRVGVEWRYNRPNSISVARRASVLLDEHIGPKT
jgi:hypothetical protein